MSRVMAVGPSVRRSSAGSQGSQRSYGREPAAADARPRPSAPAISAADITSTDSEQNTTHSGGEISLNGRGTVVSPL